jgi:hypothetical protein
VYDHLNAEGAFSKWETINAPPDKLLKILYADPSTIWIESQNGTAYQLSILCTGQTQQCDKDKWVITSANPDDHFIYFSDRKNGDCRFGDDFDLKYFQQPAGTVFECLRVYTLSPSGVDMTYYVRMSDNAIQYQRIIPLPNFLERVIFAINIGFRLGLLSFVLILIYFVIKAVQAGKFFSRKNLAKYR